MILADDAARAAFLQEFAALGGYPTGAAAPNLAPDLTAILGTVHDATFPGAVLPRLRGNRVDYFAVATTPASWRELAPLVSAFVGITATDFRGMTPPLDLRDPLEAWLSAQDFAVVSRFTSGADPSLTQLAVRGLTRLRETLARATMPARTLPRSAQGALRDFALALGSADREAAEEAIGYLRDAMLLDAMNLAFLEVQLDAQLEAWDKLLVRPGFASLVESRRPPRVTAALVEALYHAHIDPFDAVGDTAGALTAFRERLLPAAGSVFRALPPGSRPAVGKAFLLAALDSGSATRSALDGLVAASGHWPEDDRRFFDQLLALVADDPSSTEVPPGTPAAPTSANAPGAFGTEHDLRARLQRVADPVSPATFAGAQVVLVTAAELQSLDDYRTAVEYVGRLRQADREQLMRTPGFRGLWEGIAAYASDGGVPSDWLGWLASLDQLGYRQARTIAESAVAEWPIERQLADQQAVEQLARALEVAPEDRVQDGLPFLVAWLRTDEHWPNPHHDPIYEVVLTQILIASQQTPAAIGAVMSLFEARLSLRPSAVTYRLLVQGVGEVAASLASVKLLDWLLDLAELTVLYPCADAGARSAFWRSLLDAIQPLARRFTTSQLVVTQDLGTILGHGEIIGEITQAAPPPDMHAPQLDGLVVVYTLDEHVGQRVRDSVYAEYPKARVSLVNDHVNSPRLQELAKRADLFVICWRSAKHAATDAIRAARAPDRPIIYAAGKGSSSVLSEIRKCVQAAASNVEVATRTRS